jgi:hypothetical protein
VDTGQIAVHNRKELLITPGKDSLMLKYSFLLLLLPMLSGCLQVELGGPVTGARVTVTPLSGGAALVKDATTSTEQTVIAEYGQEMWTGLSNGGRAAFLGTVELPEVDFVDSRYYLVTATGGVDKDADGNGVLDVGGTRVERQVRAIMSGAQLKQPFNRVTMLSEAIYRVIEPELADLSNAEIGPRLNVLARKLVGDLNGDKASNYKDVLQWSHFSGKARYKGVAELLQRLPRAIRSTTYSDDIATLDSGNVVDYAGFRPASNSAPWRDELVGCVFPVVYGDLCSMDTLPLLGMREDNPRLADITPRVLTSAPWIVNRFEQVLARMPADMLLLFRSVTAIVIGTEIRPSYYDPLTGALYLDADYFWLTAEERGTVSTAPDYRAEFTSLVSFADLWRYVDGGRDIYEAMDASYTSGQRQLADIELPVAALLLHELAHAADSVRPAFLPLVPGSARMYELNYTAVSDELQKFSPLKSDILAGVAGVLYDGVTPTPAEATYSAARIGSFFALDVASDLYSYSSQYEDAAMLFEEAMMQLLFGVQRDVAFTSNPIGSDYSCADYRVGWGMRGRIGVRQVMERAKPVLSAILPERSYAQQISQAKKPALMDTTRDWCENLVLDGNTSLAPLRSAQRTMPPRNRASRRFL